MKDLMLHVVNSFTQTGQVTAAAHPQAATMFNYKGIIALDLDGTLLNSGKELSQTNKDTLAQAASAGWAIVPTTGRFYGAIPQIVRALPFIRYAITVNGAEVADVTNGEVIYKAEIPYMQAVDIMKFMDSYPLIYDCYQAGEAFMTADMKLHIDEMTEEFHYRKMLKDVAILEKYGVEDIVISVTAKNNAEINNIRANKGEALWALADYLGVPREKTVAFGDAANDISMIKAAGIGVVMANAGDDVKAVADYITLSNDEDGVAFAIREICLK